MKKAKLFILALLYILASCKDTDDSVPLPFHANIYSYKIDVGQVGNEVITNSRTENSVKITVEYGTDLSSVTPEIEISPYATIEPASGTAINFEENNNTQVYTLTAASGREYIWTVQIEELPDPEAIRLELIPNGGWDANVTVYHDLTYNDFLTRYSGWNGGDGCVSTELPDGSILWSFQDSFFGTVSQDRIRQDNVFVRNAGFIQTDGLLSGYQQLNPENVFGKAQTWIKYPGANENNDDHWYWGGPSQIVGDELQMVLGHVIPGDFAGVHASTDVAVFNVSDMSFKELLLNKYEGNLTWDSSIFYGPDGYTYMYATEGIGFCYSRMYVARVADHDLRGHWEYYTKTGWSTTPPENHDDYVVVAEGRITQPNVFQDGEKFYLVSQGGCFGLDINIMESDSPVGGFTNERTIYMIPDKYTSDSPEPPGYITYNAVVHHALSQEGELVVSYNINPIGFENNFNSPGTADNYRPYFVRVYNWK